jgi:hypothetical protein
VAEPREDHRKELEKLRERLILQLDILDTLRRRAAGDFVGLDGSVEPDDPATFDNLDDEVPVPAAAPEPAATRSYTRSQDALLLPPEKRPLSMPSTWGSGDNMYRQVELQLRLKQAEKCLQALRDTIADKSFQYSHVIRVAPRKGVRTRARATLIKLNFEIALHCHVYAKCRVAMVRLGASEAILSKYHILLKEDVKSSSAILNPNEPGSSRHQLSWIWQTGDSIQGSGIRECKVPAYVPGSPW